MKTKIPNPDEQPEGFAEALAEWNQLQLDRANDFSFKPRNIDEFLARHPLAEFKEDE